MRYPQIIKLKNQETTNNLGIAHRTFHDLNKNKLSLEAMLLKHTLK
jgi:hypothetical protein